MPALDPLTLGANLVLRANLVVRKRAMTLGANLVLRANLVVRKRAVSLRGLAPGLAPGLVPGAVFGSAPSACKRGSTGYVASPASSGSCSTVRPRT